MKVQEQVVGNVSVFRVSGAHAHRDAGTLLGYVRRALRRADRVKSPSRGSLIRQHRGLSTVAGSRRRRRSVGASVVSVA